MKVTVKPEYVGQTHPELGVLLDGVVYEVENVGGRSPFVEVKHKPVKRADKEE